MPFDFPPGNEESLTDALRYAVFLRDGFACLYCLAPAESGIVLSVDHVHPRALGGSNAPSNLLTCCLSCNSTKRDMSLAGWKLYLRERGLLTATLSRRVKLHLALPVDLVAGQALANARKGP
jgi:5-methylcytosine-specific restriction endonuclease McrA